MRRRWGGLLSYRYLGRRYPAMDLGQVDDTVTLRRDMRNAAGGLLLSVVGIVSPESGGLSDLEAVPNPVVHSCHVLDPGRDVRRIEIVSEVLKRGRRMGFSRSRIVDAEQPGRTLALTEGQGISIGSPPGGLMKMPVDPIEVEDSPDLPPLWRVFGAERRADGRWVLPELTAELASPDAALHLGPQFVVLETAALDMAGATTGSNRLQGIASHTMFLARGKVGPFRVEGEPTPGRDETVAVRVVLHDEGAGDRPVTAGSYLFRDEP